MSAAELPITPGTGNGSRRAGKRNRGAGDLSGRDAGRDPLDAPFAAIDGAPVDADAWPLHSSMWITPDVPPAAPAWNGLTIERISRVPAPGFIHPGDAPAAGPNTPEMNCDVLRAQASAQIPDAGLSPLGWDPRTAARKEGNE